MCVALHDADFGQTTIAGSRVLSRRTHLVIYGNEPKNRVRVPNAIVLHIPIASGTTLTRHNFIPTTNLRRLLEDMWAAAPKYAERATRGFSMGMSVAKGVTVFQMGMYIWVAADVDADPEDIAGALLLVPEDRRPQVSLGLIRFYKHTWPYDGLAIGCFNEAAGQKAEPVAIEYAPQQWDILRMPAVDAHGEIPDLSAIVRVNHRLIVGTDELNVGGPVKYSEWGSMDDRLRDVLPRLVVGASLVNLPMDNGDFFVDFSQFDNGRHGGRLLRSRGAQLTSRAHDIPMPFREDDGYGY